MESDAHREVGRRYRNSLILQRNFVAQFLLLAHEQREANAEQNDEAADEQSKLPVGLELLRSQLAHRLQVNVRRVVVTQVALLHETHVVLLANDLLLGEAALVFALAFGLEDFVQSIVINELGTLDRVVRQLALIRTVVVLEVHARLGLKELIAVLVLLRDDTVMLYAVEDTALRALCEY